MFEKIGKFADYLYNRYSGFLVGRLFLSALFITFILMCLIFAGALIVAVVSIIKALIGVKLALVLAVALFIFFMLHSAIWENQNYDRN